jgi:peptide/nickel transport system substrate-binding protein
MFKGETPLYTLAVFVILALVMVACQPGVTPTPQTVVETSVETEVVEATPVEVIQVVTPTPEPTGPRTLVICTGAEPDSNFIYGSDMLASAHILELIYDGSQPNGFNNRSFDYQPVIWEKTPSLADGDALLVATTVSEGDTVVDADGIVAILDPAADPPIMLVPANWTRWKLPLPCCPT